MSGLEQAPLTSVITKSKNVTSGTAMISRAPYVNGQYYRLRKVDITSTDGGTVSGTIFRLWDQDLSSTTAGTVGSAASALLIIGGGVSTGALSGFTTTILSKPMDSCPRIPFYAGITMAGTLGASVTLELEVV